MLMAKVLLTSDDSDSVWIWTHVLTQKGLDVVTVSSAQDTLDRLAEDGVFDLVVIDEYTAQFESIDLIQRVRDSSSIPILFLVHSDDEAKLLEAYDAGVDECYTTPISPRLFVAKVKALLRRSTTMPSQMLASFQVGDLGLNPAQGQLITADGKTINLTNLEFRLMHLLMSHPSQLVESTTIIRYVWGYVDESDSTLLKNVVYRLRRKIEPDPSQPRYIFSKSGEGYLFKPQQPIALQDSLVNH
jgi:two-component system response regulator VicR